MDRANYAVAALLAASTASCAETRCARVDACSGGNVCEVGRCAPQAALPAEASSRRFVLEPSDVAVLAADDRPLRFDDDGGPTLLVRFARTWGAADVERAYLVVEPETETPKTDADVEVRVARVLERWTSASARCLAPRIGPTSVRATSRLDPPRPLRIDVTELAREATRTRRDASLAIRIATTAGELVLPSPAPVRLDVYVR